MSEHLNNPEQEKKIQLFDDCSNCEKRYSITSSNSFAVTFEKQSECNYLHCVCPHCANQTRIFVNPETLKTAEKNEIMFNPSYHDENGEFVEYGGDYAPDNIYEGWFEVMGLERPETYELTPRHEEEIALFAKRLGQVTARIPDVFWDEMTAESAERPYPTRWINEG